MAAGRIMSFIDQLGRQGAVATGLAIDSRQVKPGDVFLAYPGAQVDGRSFIAKAVANGAVAVIAEAGAELGSVGVALLEIEGLAQKAGYIADLVYGRPSAQLWLAGVTGTNGKTSVTQWLAQALAALGEKCAVVGTLGNGFFGALVDSPNTTPDAVTVHRDLAQFLAQGASACAMEVSSIGLDQGRVNGVAFDVAVFTNLTRDHLEYHGSMEVYAEAKARLFEMSGLATAVLNLDDAFGCELAKRLAGHVKTIGYTLSANGYEAMTDRLLRAEGLSMQAAGLSFSLDGVPFSAPVVGRFNVSNLLAVTGALLARGESLERCAGALATIVPPPGRMQVANSARDAGQPLVVVDYAHTPDAIEQALLCLREMAVARGGKLVCVFGCGGDRDPGKRPQMGAIAERLADQVLLTSDNPRSENPATILADIAAGMKAMPMQELDRGRAITVSIERAAAADVILLAGKGHEPYQEIAGVRQTFSDIDCAKSALAIRQERGDRELQHD